MIVQLKFKTVFPGNGVCNVGGDNRYVKTKSDDNFIEKCLLID